MKKEDIKLWARRALVYCAGLFIMALGVVFSVKSALGVSPVTCLANVTSNITGLGLGLCTTGTYCLYIAVELLILRRDFKAEMLLQIAASFFFGLLVTLATKLLAFISAPQTYIMRMVFLLCSVPLVALGVMLYLAPQILPTPGEGLSLAVSKKTGLPVATCKIITDCCMVAVSAAASLIWFHALVGVREGTVICALTVGFVMKRMQRLCQNALLRFVGRETRLDRAIGETPDSVTEPKMVISIGREFGSGGYEIGRKLAEKLGLHFYGDEQLIPLESAESGLSEEFIRRHEQRMSHSVVYDFMTSGYAMFNEELPPLEKLFAAQGRILRRIAAQGGSCVIVGRCSDYLLYNDPNSFRIFVHAKPEFRTARIAEKCGVSPELARDDMEKTDLARARHYRHFTGREWGNTKYFNLAVDSGMFGIDGSVELICAALSTWSSERVK